MTTKNAKKTPKMAKNQKTPAFPVEKIENSKSTKIHKYCIEKLKKHGKDPDYIRIIKARIKPDSVRRKL